MKKHELSLRYFMSVFMRKTKPQGECLIWTGKLSKNKYPKMIVDRKEVYGHRTMMKVLGVNIKGKLVCHTCDNPSCLNPEHLFIGSQEDNMFDCYLKGRIRNQNSNKKYCIRGHRLSGNNIFRTTRPGKYGPRFGRMCKKCLDIRRKKYSKLNKQNRSKK